MKSALWSCLLLLAACSSQVSLGEQEEHVASEVPEASLSTSEASAPPVDAAIEAHVHAPDGSSDALPFDELHPADASPDGPHYDPCAGKACGVACTLCDPHDVQCIEPPGNKVCNPHQQCVTAVVCP
jgi:hypothetical protein